MPLQPVVVARALAYKVKSIHRTKVYACLLNAINTFMYSGFVTKLSMLVNYHRL